MLQVFMAVCINIVFVLLFVKSYTTEGLVIHVEPESDHSQWNQDCFNQTNGICSVPIDRLLENTRAYFKSNNTVLFQSNHYEINRAIGNILIMDVMHLNISGATQGIGTKVTLICSEQFGLTFVNVVNLTVNNIHFVRCDTNFSLESRDVVSEYISLCNNQADIQLPPCSLPLTIVQSTVTVIGSTEVSIQNLEIEQTSGIALVAINIYTKLILDGISLANNTVNCLVASAIPQVSFSWYTPLESYEIRNSLFKHGNITDNEQLLSSGLNIIWRDLYYRHIELTMSNITTEDNICKRGNVFFEMNVCGEAETHFHIQQLKSSYSNITQYAFRSGISILGVCSVYSRSLVTRAYFAFEDITLDNSNFIVAVLEKDPYIEVNLKRFYVYHVSWSQSIVIFHANVTLTDFHLASSSSIRTLDSTVRIDGQSTLINNNGAFSLLNTTLYLSDNTTIENNKISKYSVFSLVKSTVVFQGNTLLVDNFSGSGGCITAAYGSTIKVTGSVTFKRNIGSNGGAIALYDGSLIIIDHLSSKMKTSLRFIENTAVMFGGAVYIRNYYTTVRTLYGYKTMIPCQLRVNVNSDYTDINLVFKNNKAGIAGDEIFGGLFQYCHLTSKYAQPPLTLVNQSTSSSLYSSTPIRVCMCEDSIPNCNITFTSLKTRPGRTLTFEAVTVGQGFGVVPSIVQAQISPDIDIKDNEMYQNVGKTCTKLNYTVLFEMVYDIQSLTLKVERFHFFNEIARNNPNDVLFKDLIIVLYSIPCAKGYTFNNLTRICECSPVFVENGLVCDIQTSTVRRNKEWINATSLHTGPSNPLEQGVLVQKYCPFDYCYQTMLYVDLEYPDTQCQYNRSGTLCGKCGQNFSAKFGSSNCVQCTNTWALLIVPTVVIAGICLVLLLTVLNLTISSGTINGLIFYANILRANQSIFFSQGSTNTFLSWFIAWLNLDIGFEVCFYDGLDMYVKTWLQFVFPMYVWLLVFSIIVSSHYSTRAARLTGNNAVQVLATLFLLSYTTLLRVTIVSLSFTTLKYPDGYVQKVWLYDGNVDYLQGKHIALFIAALVVLLFLSIPYTVILVTTQWLQRYTHYALLKWVTKFLPLLEAYTGPHKIKHRYWPGLLLLLRVLLFMVFSLNVVGDPAINLLAITVTVICILTYSAYLGGVYKSWQLDTLEYSFYINLGILSSATLYNINSGGNQSQLVFTSTGIAFITFSFIIFYHVYLRLSKTVQGKKFLTWITLKIKFDKQQQEDILLDNVIIEPQPTLTLPTQSIVELHEPLLDT